MRRLLLFGTLITASAAFAQVPIPLGCGTVVDGGFSGGNLNIYSFNPLAGDAITVRLLSTSADNGQGIQLSVRSINGRTLTPRNTTLRVGTTGSLDFDIPTADTYQIQIQGNNPAATYKLVYTYLNRPCSTNTLVCGTAFADQITGALQVKSYQFPVNAGDVVSFRWIRQAPFTTTPAVPPSTTAGPSFTPVLAAFSSTGQPLQSFSNSNNQAAGVAISGRIDVAAQTSAGFINVLFFDSNNLSGNFSLVAVTLNRPCGGANSLDCSANRQGNITAAMNITSYSIEMRAGDAGSIRMAAVSPSGSSIAPAGELYDPNGNLVLNQISSNLRFSVASGGTYTLLVHDIHDGANGSATGSFAAALTRFNRPCSGATPVSCSSIVDASISGLLSTNYYSLSGTANDVYLVRVLRTDQSGSFRPRVDIYDSQANALTSIVATDLARQTITLPTTGTYSLVVSDGFDGTQSGAYTLSLVRLNRPCDPGTLSCGSPSTGNLSRPLAVGVYSYSAGAGEAFSLRMIDPAGSLQPGLEVYDPQGTPTGQSISGNFTGVDINSTSAGTYTILALDNSKHPAGGAFVLDLLRTVNPCGVSPSQGQTVSGLVSAAVPFVSYSIPASAGDSLLIRSASSTPGFSAQMELYSPAGVRLDSQTFSISRKVATSGSYTLLVGASAPRSVGGYALSWQLLNSPAGTSALQCGGSAAGSVAGSSQFRYYSTSVAAGDLMRLLLVKLTDAFSPQVELFDPSGARVATTFDITYRAAADGNYLVIVSTSSSNSETGSYTLSYQRPNNPCSPTNLTCGQTALRNVTQAGQVDTFSFSGTPGDRANIKLAQRSGGYTPFVELYDGAGNRLGTSSSGSLVATLPSTGPYSMLVRDTRSTTLGSYRVTLQDDTNACTVNDTDPPAISLVQPTGGDVIGGGTTYFIQWQSDDNVGVATHDVALSTDGGKTFASTLAAGLGGNVQSYAWPVPPDIAPTRNAVVRVTATDGAGNTQSAASAPLTLIGAGFTPNSTAAFSYDPLNQLTQAVLSDGRSITYTYDADGNLVSIAIGH